MSGWIIRTWLHTRVIINDIIESFKVAKANMKVVKPAIDPDCAIIGFLSNLDRRTLFDILFVIFIEREVMRA